VVFDARGAYTAELNEYNVIPNEKIKQEISLIEKYDLENSDKRIAVSKALVNYWKEKFGYSQSEHVIIPCTLNSDFIFDFPEENEIKRTRTDLGYSNSDVVFVYSGSSAGWQSFSLIDVFISNLMDEHPNVKLLVLSSDFEKEYEVMIRHKERVRVKWVDPEHVRENLIAADYGILYREESVTNKVASPVKFAEYLSCGLRVLVSENLGDYTEFSKEHKLYFTSCIRPTYAEKAIHELCRSNFLKEKFKNSYIDLLN
jgi:hypothetical protein